MTPSSIGPINFTSGSADQRIPLPLVKDSKSVSEAPNDGVSFCGPRIFSLGSTYTYLSIDTATNELVVSAPSPTAPAAVYTATIRVKLQIGTNLYDLHTFTVNVNV